MDDDGANEEAVESVPEKGKEAETNRFSPSGCGVWGTAITKIPDFGCQDSKEIESR